MGRTFSADEQGRDRTGDNKLDLSPVKQLLNDVLPGMNFSDSDMKIGELFAVPGK
jgi:hypothetical protein